MIDQLEHSSNLPLRLRSNIQFLGHLMVFVHRPSTVWIYEIPTLLKICIAYRSRNKIEF